VRIPQPLLDVGLDDLARRKAARGLQRPLATPLEVTRPCLAVRQDGIDVNGRNIAFGGCIEVEPPHPEVFAWGPEVFAWGWEGIRILPNPSICCPAMAPAHASRGWSRAQPAARAPTGHGHSGVRSAQPRWSAD